MKILHSIDELKMGGAQTHLLTIIKDLKKQYPEDSHYIYVLFGKNEFEVETEKLKVDVVELNLETLFQKRQFLKAYNKVKSQLKILEPDVVETHLTWSRLLVNTAAFRLGIKKRIGFEQGDIYMNSLKMRFLNYFSQFIFKKIIVCSDELKQWVINAHKVSASKLKVMYNCVDLFKFKPESDKDLKKYLNLQKKLPNYMFITVGSMGEGVNKRIDVSIKAIAELREKNIDAGLVICGDGKNRQKLEKLTTELWIENSILFLGNRNDVHHIMPHCYAYVHSAPYEPFGIVCIEAMASGLPVILPNSGGIQRIITNSIEGYIYEALNHSKLAKKAELLINSDDYNLFSKNALDKVSEYSVENYTNKLYRLYE
ncbi:glycosyltransferase family 4 protein [Psychroflexus tropicus]|uniref:glycosyltransferase family 4 protein n=1 Tax=Psychroflexus tropicus TaxID=197345 RepID=UPI0003828BDB|nr:glycosyltransferase family 4 protein [Psychroflexus tropicus]